MIQTQIEYRMMQGTVDLTTLFTKDSSLFVYKKGGEMV